MPLPCRRNLADTLETRKTICRRKEIPKTYRDESNAGLDRSLELEMAALIVSTNRYDQIPTYQAHIEP